MRKYSYTTVFVFAALLVALPMTSTNVFGQQASVGTADLEQSCGITVPLGVNLGVLRAGQVGTENSLTIATEGTVTANLEMSATDWTGTDGLVHLQSEITRFAIVIDATEYTGVDYSSKTSFVADGVTMELAPIISPAFPVVLHLQISAEGDNLELMPYAGELTQTLTFESDCILV